MVPPKDSFVYVFFEDRDVNKPRYFGGCLLKNHLPTELRQGDQWEKKWMIFKSPLGRMIFMSDDPDDGGIILRGIDKTKAKRAEKADPRRKDASEIMIVERKEEDHVLVKVSEDHYIIIDKKNKKMRIQHPSGSHIIIDKDITIQAAGNIYLNCGSANVVKVK